MVETGETINAVIWLVVAVITLLPLGAFYMSFRKVRSKKLLLTTIAFLLFFVKSLLLASRLVIPEGSAEPWYLEDDFWWSIAAFLDVGIIAMIAFALRKKD